MLCVQGQSILMMAVLPAVAPHSYLISHLFQGQWRWLRAVACVYAGPFDVGDGGAA